MADRNIVTFECPNCGAKVRSGALVCPECGSDEETGWSADTEYDDLDLPTGYDDEEENYEDAAATRASGKDGWRRFVAIAVLATLIALILAAMWF